ERSLRFVAASRPSVARAVAASALAVLLLGLLAELRVFLAELARRVGRREVFIREEMTDLEGGALGGRHAADAGDRLGERLRLDDGEARDELLRFGERTVLDRRLAGASDGDARALRRREEPFAGDEHARLHELLAEPAHLLELLAAREHASFGVLVRM